MDPMLHAVRRRALLALAGAIAAFTPLVGHAQAWPTKQVTLVTPYGPGGPNDVAARLLAEHLKKSLGQPVVVDNRPGAGGVLGSTAVMRAPADGYTLLFANSGALVVQSVLKTPAPYDPAAGFTAIAKIADAPNYIGVNVDTGIGSVGELLAMARREPGKLNYGTPGVGSFGHFVGEYLKLLGGVDLVHIPGKTGAVGVMELVAGRVQLMIDPGVLAQRAGGRVKVIATTGGTRSETYPDVPTIKESGGPDLVLVGWFGVLGPANLPREVVERVEAGTRAMLADPEARRVLSGAGLSPAMLGSAPFSALVREDMKRYGEIKARAGIQAE